MDGWVDTPQISVGWPVSNRVPRVAVVAMLISRRPGGAEVSLIVPVGGTRGADACVGTVHYWGAVYLTQKEVTLPCLRLRESNCRPAMATALQPTPTRRLAVLVVTSHIGIHDGADKHGHYLRKVKSDVLAHLKSGQKWTKPPPSTALVDFPLRPRPQGVHATVLTPHPR